jgi:hypothetical protein
MYIRRTVVSSMLTVWRKVESPEVIRWQRGELMRWNSAFWGRVKKF